MYVNLLAQRLYVIFRFITQAADALCYANDLRLSLTHIRAHWLAGSIRQYGPNIRAKWINSFGHRQLSLVNINLQAAHRQG